jgi:2-desacetyl-2-hydroxyethyl bacteriochlorophyllide A dehydrogenase
MWTSTLELSSRRVIPTRLLGLVWPGAYFASFAPLQVQNLPRQTLPATNWVRVRNRLAGISGSDLDLIYTAGDFRIALAALPSHQLSYPGHEVVGEVIQVGDDVQYLHVGDRVVLQSGPNCVSTGAQPLCRSCAIGNYNLCERRSSLSGPEPIGGGWSEEMLLHEQQLFRVPPTMSDEQAVLLEPSAVAVHAVLRRLPQPGENVLIIGAGTIGLLTLQVVRALVPQAVVSVMARYAYQIEQATRMGAAHILYPQDSYQSVARTTGAQLYTGMFGNKMLIGGYDVIYDTVGSQQTIHDSLRWTRAGGTIVIVGISLHTMRIDPTPIWYQEIDLTGTFSHGMETWPIGTYERRSTFAVAAEMIENRQVHPEKLITHRFALNNYREALSTATAKPRTQAIKVVFDYALLPASVVPNVRAAARQRRPITTTATWPQEHRHDQEEPIWPTPPDEHFIPPTVLEAPEPEPVIASMPTPQDEIIEVEPVAMPAPAPQDEMIEVEPVAMPAPAPQDELIEVESVVELMPASQDEIAEVEPIVMPTPAPQDELIEVEPVVELMPAPRSEAVEIEVDQSLISTREDESPTIRRSVSKPRRTRPKSQKTTADVQTPGETITNSIGTKQDADTLK